MGADRIATHAHGPLPADPPDPWGVALVVIVDPDGRPVEADEGASVLLAAGMAPRSGEGLLCDRDGCAALVLGAAPASPPVDLRRVSVLGCTEVQGDPGCGQWLGQRPGLLLKYLIAQRYRTVPTHTLAEALWGHAGFASSGTVRQCVHDLRRRLGPTARGERSGAVVARQGGYALDPGRLAVDADEFTDHLARARRAQDQGLERLAAAHLALAERRYGGDFLADEPDADWAVCEREGLRERMEGALDTLATLRWSLGDAAGATAALRRLASMQPLDSAVHRRLVCVLLAQHRRSAAQRCYRTFVRRLERELAMRPDFDLPDLGARDPGRT